MITNIKQQNPHFTSYLKMRKNISAMNGTSYNLIIYYLLCMKLRQTGKNTTKIKKQLTQNRTRNELFNRNFKIKSKRLERPTFDSNFQL